MARMLQLYEMDEHLHKRENLGEVADNFQHAFQATAIDALAARVQSLGSQRPRVIYLSCDPSGYGPSELAFCGMCEINDKLMIMLLATTTVEGGSTGVEQFVKYLSDLISTHPTYGSSPLVFIPEAMLGMEASHLDVFFPKRPTRITMMEAKQGTQPGVYKNEQTTRDMQLRMELLLARGSVGYTDDMIAVPTRNDCKTANLAMPLVRASGQQALLPTERADELKARVFMMNKGNKQLKQYRWERKSKSEVAAPGTTVKRFLTGKGGRGQNDDLCICILMLIYWRDIFWLSPRYAAFHAFIRKQGAP